MTEKTPEIKYWRIGDSLLDMFTYYSESGAANVHMMITDRTPSVSGLQANFPAIPPGVTFRQYYRALGWTTDNVLRGDSRQELDMPLQIGDLKLTPYVVGRVTAWDEDFPDTNQGGSTTRLWGQGGVRGAMQFWRVYDDVESNFWDIHRVRHVIEPEFNVFETASSQNRADLQPFDRDVEGISDASGGALTLHQKWQTKRGEPGHWRNVDLLVLDVSYVDYWNKDPLGKFLASDPLRGVWFLSRPELGIVQDSINVDATWRVGERVRYMFEANYNLDDARLEQLANGIAIDHSPALTYFIGNRYIRALDTDEWTVGIELRADAEVRGARLGELRHVAGAQHPVVGDAAAETAAFQRGDYGDVRREHRGHIGARDDVAAGLPGVWVRELDADAGTRLTGARQERRAGAAVGGGAGGGSAAIGVHGWTGTYEIAVAVGVVDAGDGGPELESSQGREGERGLLAGVGVGPFVGGDRGDGVGGVLEGIVLLVRAAFFDGADLLTDGDHGVAEAVELGLGFGFRGLEHQRAGDGPGHGGGVEAVVHETLGDIFNFDAGGFLEVAAVENELMGAAAVLAAEEDRVVGFEAFGHVVGVEDGDLRGGAEAGLAHHADVHPGDGEDGGAAVGGGGDGAGGICHFPFAIFHLIGAQRDLRAGRGRGVWRRRWGPCRGRRRRGGCRRFCGG